MTTSTLTQTLPLTSTNTHLATPATGPRDPAAVKPTSRRRTFVDLTRDRVADLVRVAALGVVIVWHSTLSLFHRDVHGALTMPNPIGTYRGMWMLTWLLQVMPLFFVVSGAVNAAAWVRHRHRSGSAMSFSIRRIRSFGIPLVALAAVCAALEVIGRVGWREPFVSRHLVILVPLWTLALLLAYAPLTPVLERTWRRWGATTTVGLVGMVVLSDLVRFDGPPIASRVAGVVSTFGVWLVAYHLGWVYRTAVRSGAAATRSMGRVLTLSGFGGMVLATNIDVYPRSMVATTTDAMSNLLPTTVPIMCLALFQCGLLLLARPHLARWLQRDRVADALDDLGAYALPAYLLHMFAVVALVLLAGAVGIGFDGRPTTMWWLTRPAWLAAVCAVLVPLLRLARPVFGHR